MSSASRLDRDRELCPQCKTHLPDPGGECPMCDAQTVNDEMAGVQEFTGPRRIADYRIVRELGAGGMGTVFEAYEEKMHRRVALKVLSRHHAPSEKSSLRFEQEAWIAGKLDHPNLVKVYERGEWEELAYFSMEIVDGGSLHEVVENMRRWGRDDRLDLTFGTREYIEWAIRQVIDAASGLEYAHQHGVVHRDIKPMNLLLSIELGSVKIADFGLAIDEEATRLSTVGSVLGTLRYMAPEQILGKSREIDARTDIYALGVTLFELLTLDLPFEGKTQQMYVNEVLTTEARRPSRLNQQISRDLEIVIRKALEKAPQDRYPTAEAFAQDLENVLHFRPIEARPSGTWTTAIKWIRRKPVHAALLATLLVAGPVLGLLTARELKHRSDRRQAQVEELLDQARWLKEHRRFDDALSHTARLLEFDRNHPQGLRLRALALEGQAGRLDDPAAVLQLLESALADADQLVAIHPNRAWPYLLRARLLRKLERTDEAEAQKTLAAQKETSDSDLDLLADLAMQDDRWEEAIELWSTYVVKHPSEASAITSRGFAYDQLGNDEQAMVEYRLAVGLNPQLADTYIDLARLSNDRGAYDEAEKYLQRNLELNPDSAHGHEALAMNHVDRALVEKTAGEFSRARQFLEKAELAARKSIELDDARPWAWVNLGASLIEQGRLGESDRAKIRAAIAAYERARETTEDPLRGDVDARTKATANICDALIELRELDRALQLCRELTDLLPNDAVSFYNLAGVLALLGRTEEAFAALHRDVELGDTDWRYLAHDEWFASLRDDPRFDDLLTAMRTDDPTTEQGMASP